MFLMFFSMFSNTNVEILVDDGNTAMTRAYIPFLIFVMFRADPNINICRRVQKNHLSLCTCFVYLHIRHVLVPLLDMLHQCIYCDTITTLKLRK
jgi:hypothetical protein